MKKIDDILVKNASGEMNLSYWCNMEYKRVNNILSLIEKEFDTDMNSHPNIRGYILDTSNEIKRLLLYLEANNGDEK